MTGTDEFGHASKMRRPPQGGLSGVTALVAGIATVVAPAVPSHSTIFLSKPSTGEAITDLIVTQTEGVGFSIKSPNPADARVVAWFAQEPTP